jgi:hypothetical protein
VTQLSFAAHILASRIISTSHWVPHKPSNICKSLSESVGYGFHIASLSSCIDRTCSIHALTLLVSSKIFFDVFCSHDHVILDIALLCNDRPATPEHTEPLAYSMNSISRKWMNPADSSNLGHELFRIVVRPVSIWRACDLFHCASTLLLRT